MSIKPLVPMETLLIITNTNEDYLRVLDSPQLRGSVPKNGPIDCASKNHFSLNSADGKGLVSKY